MLLLLDEPPSAVPARALNQIRYLTAAAYRDLRGDDDVSIAELFDYESSGRKAREAVRKGRRLWTRLGAWPWSCLPPDVAPAERWGSATLARAWEAWAVPALSDLEP